ncbi:hypothetical protein SDRG_08117 [Saprolegnia diclina VS20]|uniref:PH domain-containing protein n=1 Tax=Saprolegnia diclina (strain VS20) TaxID=1156394 RepID=T0QKM3_SAPDV|nr:hypothetical protein SDRG_08117 [Saprolegnia diclina VS20]EQC34345.1 hypothetical protein SDRG_08117 [Saprolegnia diclina VS20]|eukprot:XP_008612207.1 hypothetical protein SDRG_08117 [Saprolegnia diclina VS20]
MKPLLNFGFEALSAESMSRVKPPRRGTARSDKHMSTAARYTSAPLLRESRSQLEVPPAPELLHGPTKAGYLTKHNTGKWMRRRWHQRWFVLENGVLSYYKYRDRAYAHGALQLHGTGALLTIQGDLPPGTPTPFCFNISVGVKSLLVCAESDDDFREWTNAISATIGQESASLDVAVSAPPPRPTTLDNYVEAVPSWDAFALPPISLGTLASANLLIALIRYGNGATLLGVLGLLNAACVYWFYQTRTGATSLSQKQPLSEYASCPAPVPPHEPVPKAPILGTINGNKANAGCSLPQCAVDECVPGSWATLEATRFNLRLGPQYRKTKRKGPSAPALLELVATDVYRSDTKIDNIGNVVQLPMRPTASTRDLLIINCQVPCYAPSNPLWGEKQGDGDGFNFVTYYAIPEAVRDKLQMEPACNEPAIRLLRAFLDDGNDPIIRDRLKAIGIVVNPAEQALGRTERHLLETYNGQPILTRPQHRFYRGDGYFEVDIDAHLFNYVARKGLCGVTDHFGNMVVDFGFVLEGQEDDELPEQILGCVRLCKVDVKTAPTMS